jgi:hypothetical protein
LALGGSRTTPKVQNSLKEKEKEKENKIVRVLALGGDSITPKGQNSLKEEKKNEGFGPWGWPNIFNILLIFKHFFFCFLIFF